MLGLRNEAGAPPRRLVAAAGLETSRSSRAVSPYYPLVPAGRTKVHLFRRGIAERRLQGRTRPVQAGSHRTYWHRESQSNLCVLQFLATQLAHRPQIRRQPANLLAQPMLGMLALEQRSRIT